MNCYYHPDKEAVIKCTNCGRSICDECKVHRYWKTYCKSCADTLAGEDIASRNLSWFERHLDGTIALGWVTCFIVVFAVRMIVSSNVSYGVWIGLSAIISAAILIPVWVWALRKKNRSLWWLLLGVFVPFGWVVFIVLEDRSRT